jgi:hypothetical protein
LPTAAAVKVVPRSMPSRYPIGAPPPASMTGLILRPRRVRSPAFLR